MVEWYGRGETEDSDKNLSSHRFSTTNPIWTDLGWYPSICCKSSKTDRLSNGRGLEFMVALVYKKLSPFFGVHKSTELGPIQGQCSSP